MGRHKTRRGELKDLIRWLREVEGRTLEDIADYLNKEGEATLSGRGRWHSGTVSDLIRKWRIKG